MPQPANSLAVRPDSWPHRSAMPLAVPVGVYPADRPGVPLPVHVLEVTDQLERGPRRGAADGGRRVHRGGQRQRGPRRRAVDQDAAHLGAEVLQVRELQQGGSRLDVEGLAQRPERLAYRVDRVGVLFVVLRRGQQFLAQRLVLCRVGPARQRATEHQRADLVPGPPDQQFGVAPIIPSQENVKQSG